MSPTPRSSTFARPVRATTAAVAGLLAGGALVASLVPALASTASTAGPSAPAIAQVRAGGSCEHGPGRWTLNLGRDRADGGLSGRMVLRGLEPRSHWGFGTTQTHETGNSGVGGTGDGVARADADGVITQAVSFPTSDRQSYAFTFVRTDQGRHDTCVGRIRTRTH